MGCMLILLIALTIGCLDTTLAVKQKPQSKHARPNYLELSETHRTGVEGAMLRVSCTAHVESPMVSLKWTSNHEGGARFKQVPIGNNSVVMLILSLDRSDAGRYACVLVMEDGTEVSEEYLLLVKRKERKSAACKITQFKCEKSKHCIFLRYRCDGYNDCSDSNTQDDSDEECETDPCFNKFRCNNTRCVDLSSLCDHVDNCGDLSDEGPLANCLGKSISTAQPSSEEGQFGWLKITVSTIIACTVGLVILISFIVIMVFRVKMKRLREQRIARALEQMYQHGGSGGEGTSSGHGDEGPSDQHPFLSSSSSQPHYGNIIVNVNNGVQYMPGYDYPVFMDSPPPYSEFGSGDSGDSNAPPPPYSTIDRGRPGHRERENESSARNSPQTSQNVSQSTVQMFLGGARGTERTDTLHRDNADVSQNNNLGDPNSLSRGQSNGRPPVGTENSGINLGTLPGININSSFLQSLLGSHLQSNSTDNSLGAPAIANSEGGISDLSDGGRASGANVPSETQLRNAVSGGIGSAGRPIVNVAHFSTAPTRFKHGAPPPLASQSTQTPKHKAHNSHHANTVPKNHEVRQGRSAPIEISTTVNSESDGFNSPVEPSIRGDGPVSTRAVPDALESSNLLLSSSGDGANNTNEAVGADYILDTDGLSQSVSGMGNFDERTDNSQSCLASASSIMPSYTEEEDFDSSNEDLPLSDGCRYEDTLIPSEEGTCLLRKHKDRWSSELDNNDQTAETDILMPLTPSKIGCPDVASNALFSEVSRRDERIKPKPGHLSVQKGQILLHTNEGVLASDIERASAVDRDTYPSTSTSEANSDQPRVSGELVVKDGNIMLQSPSKPERNLGHGFRNTSNSHSGDGVANSNSLDNSLDPCSSSFTSLPPTNNNGAPDTSNPSLSSFRQSSTSHGSTQCKEIADLTDKKQDKDSSSRFSGELNIKDGCLVLEAPKHTPSSRVLSHLQGAYAAEQREDDQTDDQSENCVEAVVNTKRPAGVVSRPQLPKFASDIVLPFKNQQT